MIQILHIPGMQYEGETDEQAAERDRRIIEANRKLRAEWHEGERQRTAPMRSMQKWADERGINRMNAGVLPDDESSSTDPESMTLVAENIADALEQMERTAEYFFG